jgi:hypothetical protein
MTLESVKTLSFSPRSKSTVMSNSNELDVVSQARLAQMVLWHQQQAAAVVEYRRHAC